MQNALNGMCKSCKIVKKITDKAKNNYEYWIATEVFIILHNGKDCCNNSNKKPTK